MLCCPAGAGVRREPVGPLSMMWSRVGALVLAGLVGLPVLVMPAAAQGVGRVVLQRIGGPVRLDGLSFEPAWEGVTPFLPTQYEPDNGAAPTERTEFRVAYDDAYLYFSLRAYDSDPEGIRANMEASATR